MSRVELIVIVRRLRQEANEIRGRDVDVHIADGLRALGWTGGKMPDEGDFAAKHPQLEIDSAIEQRERYTGHSAMECEECGEPIPEQRRQAVPGCRRCIDCQTEAERR